MYIVYVRMTNLIKLTAMIKISGSVSSALGLFLSTTELCIENY